MSRSRMRAFLARLSAASDSLQFRVVLGTVLALALGISAVTWSAVHQVGEDTLRLQHQRELGVTVHTADLLSHRVVDLQRALKAAATRLDRRTVADEDAAERVLVGEPVLRMLFSDVDLLSTEGRMRLYLGPEGVRRPDLDLHDREYFRRTMAQRRGVVSDPVRSRLLGAPVLLFTEPLQDAEGVYGVLAGTLQIARGPLMEGLFDGDPEAGGEARMVVTDASGRLLAGVPRDRLLSSVADDPGLAAAFSAWQGMGSAIEPAGQWLPQPGAMVTLAGVPGPEWLVWRRQPESGLLAPLVDARRRAMVMAVVLVALMSLVSWAALRRLLRPLDLLEQRARYLFDGTHLAHEAWPDARGEIGRLARVLQHAAGERSVLEATNRLTMKKLESVMSAAPVGIAFTRDQRFELVSAEFCRLFGVPESELLGSNPRRLHASDEDDDRLNEACEACFSRDEPYVGEWRLRHADGSLFWAQLRGRPVDAQNRRAGTIWTVSDIGEQIARREQLEWSATHDTLTGLGNRHAFEETLVRVFAARPRSIPAALVIIDLDHFKPVNDHAGHIAGDAVLKAVARAIEHGVRNSDLVARIGGDEFALVLERCPADVALRVAENVREAVHAVGVAWAGRELRVGASIGVAPLTMEMADVAAWMEAADAACYEAKAHGRGRVRSAWNAPRGSAASDPRPSRNPASETEPEPDPAPEAD